MYRIFYACALLFIVPFFVTAHTFNSGDISVTLTQIHDYQLEAIITAPDILTYEDTLPASGDPWEHHVRTSLLVNQNSIPCFFSMRHFVQDADAQTTHIDGVYQCGEKITNLSQFTIQSFLFGSQYEEPHINLITTIGTEVHRMHFTRHNNQHPHTVRAEVYGLAVIIPEYIQDGIAHIIGGTDHVLFLISLLVSTTSILAALTTMSAFALAHSVTLFLAVYGIVSIDAGIVEPAIAATIFLTALMTALAYMLKKESLLDRSRIAVVSLLGLVHGLGFGGDLSSVQLPADTFLAAMLSFTMGIELGQIVIAVCLLPFLWLLKKQNSRRTLIIVTSCVIALVALYWNVTRLL